MDRAASSTDDFASAYLVGSVALAVILFEGGLKTQLSMLRLAVWPALALAVIGVGITAAIVAAAVMWIAAVPFAMAMLVGAAVAPTDAAAVAALLGRARLALPERINALLEVESGLNDPMSIFLTVLRHPRHRRRRPRPPGSTARCCSRAR